MSWHRVLACMLSAGCDSPAPITTPVSAPTTPTTPAPELAPVPLPDPPTKPAEHDPEPFFRTWSPGHAFDDRYELHEDWTPQPGIDALEGRTVGVWLAVTGRPAISWRCHPGTVGARGAEVRGLGSGIPRSVVVLNTEELPRRAYATCVLVTPSCDFQHGMPSVHDWSEQVRRNDELPDANGDGRFEWVSWYYQYPQMELRFGFGGSDRVLADCSVLVGG